MQLPATMAAWLEASVEPPKAELSKVDPSKGEPSKVDPSKMNLPRLALPKSEAVPFGRSSQVVTWQQ